ncbi:anthrone oxygenase family protein [Aquimarina macrocephali]|uniref:anthrone oxygenase family protein n=1 Tax=Aquimarina macrocephali TaxID=666563 RepID=UPI0004649367|nr:DUF1772 domain-containing protein [Aquimarina macrocephali]
MELSLKSATLILTILFTGMSAGLCFIWSNTIAPGIGKLNDIGFLQSFKEMNRTILNPLFFVVFFSPFLLNLLNLYLFKNVSNTLTWLLIMVTVCYFFGVVFITIFGNVPLNEMLDKTDLASSSIEELKHLREKFEVKWNRFHLIRTLASIISFLLLILSLIQSSKSNI